jgi:hypothetical protein
VDTNHHFSVRKRKKVSFKQPLTLAMTVYSKDKLKALVKLAYPPYENYIVPKLEHYGPNNVLTTMYQNNKFGWKQVMYLDEKFI